jgi:hypothetical protein
VLLFGPRGPLKMVVFLSHAHEDTKFVNLLARMLNFHGIEYWYSAQSLEGGDRYASQIISAVSDADRLLVTISRSAIKSQWVAEEVRTFLRVRPNGTIVPLLLENVSREEMKALNIDQFQYINFSECMATGFDRLFQSFRMRFLEKPKTFVARTTDRRRADPLIRLRAGFWKIYEKTTGYGKFDVLLELAFSQTRKVADALRDEAAHFLFFDRRTHKEVEIDKILYPAVCEVYRRFEGTTPKAVYITDVLVGLLSEGYEIRMRDRRDRPDGPPIHQIKSATSS